MTSKPLLQQKLARLRAASGWGLREAARRIGVSPSYLSLLETGRRNAPGLAMLRRLAAVYGVPLASLFQRDVRLHGDQRFLASLTPESRHYTDVQLRRAFSTALKDRRLKGLMPAGYRRSPADEMRVVVTLYERLTGTALLPRVRDLAGFQEVTARMERDGGRVLRPQGPRIATDVELRRPKKKTRSRQDD